uniref:ASPIC/UnbV domain-containing protein n=1 Tax=Strigamia maritima TaxID=126957 RepID=T1IMK6_STRMM
MMLRMLDAEDNPHSNPRRHNYGIASTDVDNDGEFELLVAGYSCANLLLKWDRETQQLYNLAVDDPASPYYELRDSMGSAVGVAAADIDGDGREEIYVVNSNQAFSGRSTYSDKLFKFRNGRYEDLLADPINRHVATLYAGRSVACIDRSGTGKFSFYVANYAKGNVAPHELIEMDESRSDVPKGIVALKNVAREAGVEKFTGGRGVAVGPILSLDGRLDIFCNNEKGSNFLYKNNADGTFTDVSAQSGVDDPQEHGRGIALADLDGDGKVDIVWGNWNGPQRMFVQRTRNGVIRFEDVAPEVFSRPCPIRSLLIGDFDNDSNLEIVFNTSACDGPFCNKLFRVCTARLGENPLVTQLDIGDAEEEYGMGTGGVVADINGDGRLELVMSHGEWAKQPLTIYNATQGIKNCFLRVMPVTQFGAPARGARVELHTANLGPHLRIIDAGSGYLSQMEPVAHFGLGTDVPVRLEVTWPDGSFYSQPLGLQDLDTFITVNHPSWVGASGFSFRER